MNKIRYGIIGLKGAGRYHIQFANIIENIELVALSDTDKAFLNDKSKELGVQAFSDYRDMLDSGAIDAVSIATPAYLHFEMGMNCLQAGVHVFMEKPFALRLSDAKIMLSLAKEKNLKIAVAHQYRTHRSSQIIKEVIGSGAIGNIQRILWTCFAFRTKNYYTNSPWRKTWKHSGGGLLMNQAIHDLDLICWLVGKPVTVSSLIADQLHKNEIEDIACANIQFQCGALASFQGSMNQPNDYCVRQIAGDEGIIIFPNVKSLIQDEDDEILFGKYKSSLTHLVMNCNDSFAQPKISWQRYKLPDNNKPIQKVTDNKLLRFAKKMQRYVLYKSKTSDNNQSVHGWPIKWKQPVGHWGLMIDFADAIINNREPLVNGENTLSALELSNAIVLSALRKKTVELPLDLEEYDDLFNELKDGIVNVPKIS